MAFLSLGLRQTLQRFAHALAQQRHIDLRLAQQRHRGTALLVEQRRHQVQRLEHVVVAADGEALRIGQGLLQA
jgi:hypothetical protein